MANAIRFDQRIVGHAPHAGIDLALQISSELTGWEDSGDTFTRNDENGTAVWTSTVAIGEATFQAVRLSATRLLEP